MSNVDITKEKFIAYENVRLSGLTNMFDTAQVMELATEEGIELSSAEILEIMNNYQAYREKYIDSSNQVAEMQ